MKPFCQIPICAYEPTCCTNPNNPTCIDLVKTNRPKSFQNSTTFEIELLGFHKMILTVLKVSFKKKKTRVLNYRKYEFYDNNIFQEQFLTKLNHICVSKQDNSLIFSSLDFRKSVSQF